MRLFTSAWMPLAVLAIGVAATAVAVRAISDSSAQRDQERFDRAALQLADKINCRLNQDITLLNGSAKMLAVAKGGYAGPEDYLPFVEAFGPQDRPGNRAFGYARRLSTGELPAMVEDGRRRFCPDFKIHPETTPYDEHFVVLMTCPSKQAWWTGFDMYSDGPFRTTIQRVRTTGAVCATEVTMNTLREGKAPEPVFAILAPVVKPSGKPTTAATAESQKVKLLGVAFAAYRASDLMQSIFRSADISDVAWTVRDAPPGTAGGLLLHQSTDFDATNAKAAYSADVPVTVAGRTWTLAVRGTPAFADPIAAARTKQAWFVGVSASVLAAVLLWLQGRVRNSILRRAAGSVASSRDARAVENRLDLVLESLGVGMWSCDLPNGEVTWDDRAKTFYFLPQATSPTIDQCLDNVHPEDRTRLRETLASAMQAGKPFDIKYRTVSPTGDRTRWLRSIGQPEISTEQPGAAKSSRFNGVTIDITVQEVAWLDADTARRQAEESSTQALHAGRAKDEFLATIGHELRAPLSAILGWAQLLRRQGDRIDPAVDEGLAVIERNARAQDRLVADLVDVSLISAGAVRMDVELVDLAAAARAAVDAARPAAQAKQVDLQLALDLTAGPVRGDPGRLQQVVANLLTNAVKFTPGGGRVRVSVSRAADQVILTVADTGEGIDPAFLPHVFDRFRQQDASTARRHGGLGLGLSIVRHLVELHHGIVRVESAGLGEGATFVVELPAAFPASPPPNRRRSERSIDESAGDLAKAALQSPAEPLKGIKVLFVDDDPDTLKAASGVLKSYGANVLTAASAPEALAAVMADRPHVILCDIGMPEIDGYEFLRRLRALSPESGGNTPAAALTGFARPEDCLRVLTCGFQTHIPKPVEAEELVQAVLRLSGAGIAETRSVPSSGGRKEG